MQQVYRIPSKLYSDLWRTGNSTPSISGDKLIAIYSLLKKSRNKEVKYYAYKAKNNKTVSDYALLRAKTNISLSTLKKYVPVLIEKGLCFFDVNGDFVLIGNRKLNDKYGHKLLPIVLGKNVIETSYNVISIRIFSSEKKQKTAIEHKKTRSELYDRRDNPRNLKEYKKIKKLIKNGYEDSPINEKISLSVQGFAKLKDGEAGNKSKGCYWKSKLKSRGIVKTKRVFDKISKMTYSQFLLLKNSGTLERGITYFNGYMVREEVSTFSPTNLVSAVTTPCTYKELETVSIKYPLLPAISKYKKKEYLQFDMIDFWVNG